MAPRNDKSAAHVALYQDAVDNLRFIKLQQWRVAYYALLIYAVVFFLRDQTPLNTSLGKNVLAIVIVVACLFSVSVLLRLECSMAGYRNRIDWFHGRYFSRERRKLQMDRKTSWLDRLIIAVLLLVTVSGAGLTAWTVWCSSYPHIEWRAL